MCGPLRGMARVRGLMVGEGLRQTKASQADGRFVASAVTPTATAHRLLVRACEKARRRRKPGRANAMVAKVPVFSGKVNMRSSALRQDAG